MTNPTATEIGIVSSQKNPQDFKTWMRYHVDTGIRNFYIIVEDTPTLGPEMTQYARELTALTRKRINLYYENAPSVDRSTEDNFTDILSRQAGRVDRMLVRAREDGVSWVFHIDDDELAYPGTSTAISTWQEVLGAVSPSCMSVHLTNYEAFSPAIPKSHWGIDSGVMYLPRACALNFAAYANGKSASRTDTGQHAWGVHHFGGGQECELPEHNGVILHHESLPTHMDDIPPARWIEKNKLRVKDDKNRIPFKATHDAIEAVKSGDPELMKHTWTKYRSQTGENYLACKTPVHFELPSYSYGQQ